MRILYVVSRALEINTSASIRNRATILGFLENGYEVDLFTSEPDKNHSAYDESLGVKQIPTHYVKLGGIQKLARVGRRFSWLKYVNRIVGCFLNRYEIYDNLKSIINFVDEVDLKKNKYDYIISSSDPKSSHLFVEKLLYKYGEHFGGKWIQIWGDPFLGDITQTNKRKKNKIYKEEKRLLKEADRVFYVSRLTLEEQGRIYPESASKMRHIPIPYMEAILLPLKDLSKQDTVKMVYCGDYNTNTRNILPLYQAVKQMNGLHLTICGCSDCMLDSCDNITVNGRLSWASVQALEREADILVHLCNLHGSQIPGKIYQYSGTNKPILFILDGDISKIKEQFEEYNRYEFCLNEMTDIQKTVKELIHSGKKYLPSPEFDKRIIIQKLLNDIN